MDKLLVRLWEKRTVFKCRSQLRTVWFFSFPLIKRYTAPSAEIFKPAGLFPTSYLVVVIYCSMGSVCPLPCTSSPTAAVDGSAAGPSSFPFHVSQKCLGFELRLWSVSLKYCELPRTAGSYSCTRHHNGCPAALGFAFSFSQSLLTAIDPNRAHSCCVFQPTTVIVAFISHLVSPGCCPLPQWPSMYSSLSPSLLTLSIFSRCFATGHYPHCQKFPCGELYFNTEQHHLLCSTLGQGSHSQWADTSDKAERWSGPVAFFSPFLRCRCLFASTIAVIDLIEPHRLTRQGAVVVEKHVRIFNRRVPLVSKYGWGIEWEGFPLGRTWQPGENLLHPPCSLLSTSLCHYLL